MGRKTFACDWVEEPWAWQRPTVNTIIPGLLQTQSTTQYISCKMIKEILTELFKQNINKRVRSKEETLTTGLDEESFNQWQRLWRVQFFLHSWATSSSAAVPPDPMLVVGAWAPPHVTLLHVASCPETHWGSVPPHASGKPADQFTPPSSSSCRLWGWAQGEKKENVLLSHHQASARDCRH